LGALLAAYVVEAGIWFLLVKTYSRGGLVAAVAGMVLFFLLEKKNSSEYRVAGSEHQGPSAPPPRRAAAHCNERAPARSIAAAGGHYSLPATRYPLLATFAFAQFQHSPRVHCRALRGVGVCVAHLAGICRSGQIGFK